MRSVLSVSAGKTLPLTRQSVWSASSSSIGFLPLDDSLSLKNDDHSFHLEDSWDDSSDEEHGVFLGPHNPLEVQLVSKLSNQSPAFASSIPSGRAKGIVRLKKRDSRDFIRRKTILSSAEKNTRAEEKFNPKGKEKVWEGGCNERFRERGTESDSDWSSCSSFRVLRQISSPEGTPSKSTSARPAESDLTLDFSAFRLNYTPPTSVSSYQEETKEELDRTREPYSEDDEGVTSEGESSDEGDSDKENTALAVSPGTETDDGDETGPMRDSGVSLGFDGTDLYGCLSEVQEGAGKRYEIRGGREAENRSGVVAELDMGELRLSDFSDPETEEAVTMQLAAEESPLFDNLGTSTEGEDEATSDLDQAGHLLESESGADHIDISSGDTDLTIRVMIVANVSVELASEYEVSELFSTPTSDRLKSTAESNPSSPSTDLDSPLPIARAGPVIIPQLGSHHLPNRTTGADAGSPIRSALLSASPIQDRSHFEQASDAATVRLGQLNSPEVSAVELENSSVMAEKPLNLASLSQTATPSASKAVIVADALGAGPRANKTLRSFHTSTALPGSLDRPSTVPSEGKVVERARAIKSQLDSAFQSRLGAMGPPQRAVSSSSSISSSSNASSIGQQRPPSRFGLAGPMKGSRSVGHVVESLGNPMKGPSKACKDGGSMYAAKPQSGRAGPGRAIPPIGGKPSSFSAPSLASASGVASRPAPCFAQSAQTMGSRPPLAPRMRPLAVGRPSVSTISNKMARPPPHFKPSGSFAKSTGPINTSPRHVNIIPLKRPIVALQSSAAKSLVTVGGQPARPTLGLPSRLVHESPLTNFMPVFSLGFDGSGEACGSGSAVLKWPAFRSPVRPIMKRPFTDAARGTPLGVRTFKVSIESR